MSLEETADLTREEGTGERIMIYRPFYEATAGELSADFETPRFWYNGEQWYWTARNLDVFSKLIVLSLRLIEEMIDLPADERRSHWDHTFPPFDASIPREEAMERGAGFQFRLCIVEFALLGNRPPWYPPPPGSVEGNRMAESSGAGVEAGLRANKNKPTRMRHRSGLREDGQASGSQETNEHHQGHAYETGMGEGSGQTLGDGGGAGGEVPGDAGRLLRRRSSMRPALNADGTPRRSYA